MVSEPNNLAKYENYEFQQQSIPSSESGKRKTRRKIRKPKLFRYRKVIAAGLLGGVLVTFISVAALLLESSVHSSNYITADGYTEYNIRCMIDESTGTRYIFDADTDYGIAITFRDEDPENFLKLKELSTGNTYYCHNSYLEKCAVVTPENGHTYVIPDYMVYPSMETENQQYYEVCSNANTNKWIFVPNYIIDQCEAAVTDAQSENNEFFEEEAEDEIAEETPENPEEQVYPYGDEPAEIN